MPTTKSIECREGTLFAAIELSKASWLLAVQTIDAEQPSLHHVNGGDVDALIERLDRSCEQHCKRTGQTPRVVVCYEAG